MHRSALLFLLASSWFSTRPAAGEDGKSAPPVELPVRKVVLFTSGVGYFEHEGTVTDRGSAVLHFQGEQINDVLKSLVVQDEGGQVGAVEFPSHAPLGRTLGGLQVDLSKQLALADLLGQLRGAEVSVSFRGEDIQGLILGVEERFETASPLSIRRGYLNVLAGSAMRSFRLEDVRSIELQDPAVQEDLRKALNAHVSARQKDRMPVTINFIGEGRRRVRVGYVVEAPVWKASYRLVLPQGEEDRAYLQGWAIVENQTESDWDGVELSLVSGSPISFTQNLHEPLYVSRRAIPVGPTKTESDSSDGGFGGGGLGGGGLAGGDFEGGEFAGDGFSGSPFSGGVEEEEDDIFDIAESVASSAAAKAVGELFHYTVPSVTLPTRQSALIPIVTDDVEIERVLIYRGDDRWSYPFHGVMVRNTTGNCLKSGPVTVIDGGYAGDAMLDELPPDQHRFLPYSVALDFTADVSKENSELMLESAVLKDGVLQMTTKRVFVSDYFFDNLSEKEKTVVVEHRREFFHELVDSPEPFEDDWEVYRFKLLLPARDSAQLAVKTQRIGEQIVKIMDQDSDRIAVFAKADRIPPDVRQALERTIALGNVVSESERRIKTLQAEIKSISDEQGRIRSNLEVLGADGAEGEYYSRLLTKLNDQESRIESLQQEIRETESELAGKRQELRDYVSGLNIG